MFPRKGKVGLILKRTSTVSVFIVGNVLPAPVPAEILLLRLFLAINDYFHAELIQTVLLVLV
jgi:hypothetical protein